MTLSCALVDNPLPLNPHCSLHGEEKISLIGQAHHIPCVGTERGNAQLRAGVALGIVF